MKNTQEKKYDSKNVVSFKNISFRFDDADEYTLKNLNFDCQRGEISFRNVSFGYTYDKMLMKNIKFTAKPGQKIAVVGSTGAGKTTLINLLMRFYEVNGGQITIDSIPTTDLTRKDLRSNFGMVLQDTWLFSGTVAEINKAMKKLMHGRTSFVIAHLLSTIKDADTIIFMENGTIITMQSQ